MIGGDVAEGAQRLGDDLVHVEVLVVGEAAAEMDVAGALREGLVPCENSRIFGAWNRVIRVASGLWVLVDNAGPRMLLAGEVLKLGNARVGVVVGVVDDGCGLELLDVMRFVLELE